MAPILPQELIDQVIDHLWKDVASLTACALVSHACLASARTHLFHEQRIVGKNAFVLLEGLLVDRPILAQYIRKLSITDPMSVITAQSWTSRIPALVVALPRLTAFEVVGVHHLPFALDAEARAAFARITHVVLADVYFDDLADALALLTAARHARTVCLYRVGWTRAAAPYSVPQVVSEPGPRQSGRPPLCLKSLVLDSWAASTIVKQWLLPFAEQGELDVRTLMVRWRERDAVDVLDSLLRACGSALERLYVELPTAVDGECLSVYDPGCGRGSDDWSRAKFMTIEIPPNPSYFLLAESECRKAFLQRMMLFEGS